MRVFLVTLMLLVFCSHLYAQQILIYGQVEPSVASQYETDELIIRKRITADKRLEEPVLKIPLSKDGRFRALIPATTPYVYLSFEFENKVQNNWTGRTFNASWPRQGSLQELYFFEAGDSVRMSIRNDGDLLFSGRGSAKLNCQHQLRLIDAIHPALQIRKVELESSQQIFEMLELEEKAFRLSVDERLLVLNSYRSQLSDSVFQLIRTDMLAAGQHELLSSLARRMMGADSSRKELFKTAYARRSAESKAQHETYSMTGASAYFVDMLLEREIDDHLIPTGDFTIAAQYTNHPKLFTEIYASLRSKYSGEVMQKLLYVYLRAYSKNNSSKAKPAIEEAILASGEGLYADLLRQWRDQLFSAFPFVLFDANDQPRTLEEFKGKLLIIDFWFTGCGPCQQLAKRMDSIYTRFGHRKDATFITVSTDPKSIWMKSVRTKAYCSEGMVNLHTNGKGFNDPLIKHYGFMGFPQQLIIGKDGRLITSSPPRADISRQNYEAFVRLIEEQLR